MVLATDGSFAQKMSECIAFSERNRCLVAERSAEIDKRARAHAMRRHALTKTRISSAMLDVIAGKAVANDDVYRLAVADEQWGARLATMYTQAELVLEQRKTNMLLRELITLITQTSDTSSA